MSAVYEDQNPIEPYSDASGSANNQLFEYRVRHQELTRALPPKSVARGNLFGDPVPMAPEADAEPGTMEPATAPKAVPATCSACLSTNSIVHCDGNVYCQNCNREALVPRWQ